ncbi:MAG TPA: DUF2203 domain-containing protein [Gemmatimonadaceae bacterium]|nr:DUF2203 domain-containing protein [Gemmatimonadaceae bacterium]
MAQRAFTVEQANRMLPLVRRIVEDLVVAHGAWQQAVGQFEVASSASTSDAEHYQRETERLAREIDGYLRELSDLGVEFKGFEEGLIDFPSEMDGRSIYLCWKLGEPSVMHWHEIDAGFAGRKQLEMVEHRST